MAIKNKRGIMFTTITIILLSLLFVSYTAYSNFYERESIEKRVKTINSLALSFEKDLSRQLYISSYRAVLATQSHITEKGDFIDDAETSMKEALESGKINGTNVEIMEGYTLPYWKNNIYPLWEKTNLDINYTILSLNLYQTDPWNLLVSMKLNLTIKDRNDLASVDKIEEINTTVNIEGFEDPVYLVNSNGLITNKIIKTPFENFTNGSDTTNLLLHVNNSYYVSSPSAPNFLSRLEGNLVPSENGIESLVNLEKLASQGIQTSSKSVVDYIYFSTNSPQQYQIQGMPSWFRIDEDHLEKYGVSNLTIS